MHHILWYVAFVILWYLCAQKERPSDAQSCSQKSYFLWHLWQPSCPLICAYEIRAIANQEFLVRDFASISGFLPTGNSIDPQLQENDQHNSEDNYSLSDKESINSKSSAEALLEAIINTINNLYQLATKIRAPTSRLPSSKARFFKRINESTGIDLIDQMREADLKHVEELFWEYRAMKALKSEDLELAPGLTAEPFDV